jgi:hypothetical protein
MADESNGGIGSGAPSGSRIGRQSDRGGQQEWLDFPKLIGTHLSWRRSTGRTVELVAADGSVWATITNRGGDLFRHTKVLVDGRTFEVRLRKERKARFRALVDSQTDETVLEMTGRHFNRRGDTKAILSDRLSLEFPVAGSRPTRAVMHAVDDMGNVLIHYRLKKVTVGDWWASRLRGVKRVEIVVTPMAMAIPNCSVLVAGTSKLLVTYFEHPSGA